jgi:hypothetical protein
MVTVLRDAPVPLVRPLPPASWLGAPTAPPSAAIEPPDSDCVATREVIRPVVRGSRLAAHEARPSPAIEPPDSDCVATGVLVS